MADLEIIGTIEQVSELARCFKDKAGILIGDRELDRDGRQRWHMAKVDNQALKHERAAKCDTCRWFWEVHKGDGYSFGDCRFNAPVVMKHGEGIRADWPTVGSGHFCGQHEPIGPDCRTA